MSTPRIAYTHNLNPWDDLIAYDDGSYVLKLDYLVYYCPNVNYLIAILMFPVYGSFPEVLS